MSTLEIIQDLWLLPREKKTKKQTQQQQQQQQQSVYSMSLLLQHLSLVSSLKTFDNHKKM